MSPEWTNRQGAEPRKLQGLARREGVVESDFIRDLWGRFLQQTHRCIQEIGGLERLITQLTPGRSLNHQQTAHRIEQQLKQMHSLCSNLLTTIAHLETYQTQLPKQQQYDLQSYSDFLHRIEILIDQFDAKLAGEQFSMVEKSRERRKHHPVLEQDRMIDQFHRMNRDADSRQKGRWERLPAWMVEKVAVIAFRDLTRSPQRRTAGEQTFSGIDQQYENIPDHSGFERRRGLSKIWGDLLLRAALYYDDDPTDEEGDLHRLKNALGNLADEWETRFSPVAERYRMLHDRTEDLVKILAASYRQWY